MEVKGVVKIKSPANAKRIGISPGAFAMLVWG
jgi:hypothetical protein